MIHNNVSFFLADSFDILYINRYLSFSLTDIGPPESPEHVALPFPSAHRSSGNFLELHRGFDTTFMVVSISLGELLPPAQCFTPHPLLWPISPCTEN